MTQYGDDDLEALQARLGYRFRDPLHLRIALTHKSWANEHGGEVEHNERLEFLGDAVLSLVVGHLLMHHHPEWNEGTLSKARSALVSATGLAELATELELGGAILLGRGEEHTGGREKPSILSDAFEAVTAAVYLDGGFERTFAVIEGLLEERLARGDQGLRRRDPKTHLQERIQAVTKRPPSYVLRSTTGPEHDLRFTVAIEVDGREIASGTGRTKKEAEQQAAAGVLRELADGRSLRQVLSGGATIESVLDSE